MRVAIRTLSLLAAAGAGAWLWAAPDFEPAITMLLAGVAFLSSLGGGSSTEEQPRGKVQVEQIRVESDSTPFSSELWPGEGIPRFKPRLAEVTLYERPDSGSPIARRLEFPAAVEIPFSAFRFVTTTPGIVRAARAGAIHARSFGSLPYLSRDSYYSSYSEYRSIHFNAGDVFEFLQYRAEGTGLIRVGGEVLDAELPWVWEEDSGFEVLSDPVHESWIQLDGHAGVPVGWLNVDESAEEVGRAL